MQLFQTSASTSATFGGTNLVAARGLAMAMAIAMAIAIAIAIAIAVKTGLRDNDQLHRRDPRPDDQNMTFRR